MERYVPQSRLASEEIPSKVAEICNAAARATSASAGTNRFVVLLQCVHGFGHGLLADGFLPLRGAIKVCQSLAPGFVRDCVGGVVMMHVDAFLHGDDEEQFAQSMTSACAPVEELNDAAVTRQCASAVGEAIMWRTGQDLDKSLALCARLLPAQRSSCAAGARLEQRTSQPPKGSGG
jgi:hypothetical protein